ncbi:MAG: sulfurtransferase TusA family protein [Pseudomonadota bacterium]
MENHELSELEAARVVDARWSPCPGTLLKAKESITRMPAGEIMEILSHDPEARRDILAWAGKAGHEFLGFLEGEGYYRIFVMKKVPE